MLTYNIPFISSPNLSCCLQNSQFFRSVKRNRNRLLGFGSWLKYSKETNSIKKRKENDLIALITCWLKANKNVWNDSLITIIISRVSQQHATLLFCFLQMDSFHLTLNSLFGFLNATENYRLFSNGNI